MMNLKEAIEKKKLDQFIKEHEQETGDSDKLDATISSMVGKSQEVQEASDREHDENCDDTQTR